MKVFGTSLPGATLIPWGTDCAMVVSNIEPLPPCAAELVREYNMWTPNNESGGLFNFLTGPWKIDDDGNFKADLMKSTIPNHEFFVTKTKPLGELSETGFEATIKMEGAEQLIARTHAIRQSALVYIHQAFYSSHDPITVTLTEKSILVDWETKSISHDWILELCAGGFGGWHFASKFLSELDFPKCKFASIEVQLQAAVSNALNHDAVIVTKHSEVSQDFLSKIDRSVVFHQAVQDNEWLPMIAPIRPFAAVISAPCPPWSVSGLLRGLNDENGLVMLHCIGRARILQPEWIAMEQVAGFKCHNQYQTVLAAMNWAGYDLVEDVLVDQAEMTPVRRNRWLSIFCRTDLQRTDRQPWKRWIKRLSVTPANFDSFEELPLHECRNFEPTIRDAEMYLDSSLMPGALRPWTKSQMIQARIPGINQKQGTFMHNYGNSHNLPLSHLSNRGLFGFFVRQSDSFRFWTPWEEAMMHLQIGGLILLKPKEISWKILGNMISIPHGVLVLMNLFCQADPEKNYKSPTEIFQILFNSRLRNSNTTRLQDEFAWYLDQPHLVARMQNRLQKFVHQLGWSLRTEKEFLPDFPPGKWWHPVFGLQTDSHTDLPPTIDYAEGSVTTTDLVLATNLECGIYHVQSHDIDYCIDQVWSHQFRSSHKNDQELQANTKEVHETVILAPTALSAEKQDALQTNSTQIDESDENTVLLLRKESKLIIFDVPAQVSWSKLQQRLPGLPSKLFDHYGQLHSMDVPKTLSVLQEEMPLPIMPLSDEFDLLQLHQVQVEARTIPSIDTLQIHLKGTPTQLGHVAHLWSMAFPAEWQRQNGCVLHMQELDEAKIQLLFRSIPKHLHQGTTKTPSPSLKQIIPTRLFQTGMEVLQSPEPDALILLLKHQGRVLHVWKAAPNQTFDPVLDLLRHAFALQDFGFTPAVICKGKRCADKCTVGELQKSPLIESRSTRAIICHIVDPIQGGGQDFGAKNAWKQMLQSKTAALFLEYGIQMQQVAEFTSKLTDQVGFPRLQHLHHSTGAVNKHETFRELCQMCDISLPKGPTAIPLTDAKFAKLARTKNYLPAEEFEVEAYLLQEGYFKNEDDSNAAILSTFQPRSSGVFLSNAKQAEQWLSTQQPISEDELALFVVGLHDPSTTLTKSEIVAPAVNAEGKAVILQGVLIQLGSRSIKIPESDQPMVDSSSVHVCGIVVYKQDHDTATWDQILQAPVKTVKNLLALQGFANVLGRPWGRSFRLNDAPAPPHLADRTLFHAEVKPDRYEQLLARSGFIKIFLTPKDEDGKASQLYRIIWYQGQITTLETLTAGQAGVAGLVKNRKGFGLRVRREAFDSLWKLVNPGQALPEEHDDTFLYRVQPFPNGTSKEDLTNWGQQQDWSIHPIKTAGAKQWIVGAKTHPPPLLLWNGKPVIAHQIQKKQHKPPVIVAGPNHGHFRPTHTPAIEKSTDKPNIAAPESTTNIFRMGDPWADPWAKPSNSQRQAPINPPRSAASDKAPDASQPTRQIPGPVASQFQLQEQRLQAVEASLHNMQKQQADTTTQVQHLEKQLLTHQEDTKQGIAQLVADNKDFKQALLQQDQRLASSFDEIKKLFLQQGTKRSRPSPFSDESAAMHSLTDEEMVPDQNL